MNISHGNTAKSQVLSPAGFALNATDEVFATAMQFGRTVLDTTFSGIVSLRQLVAEVVKALGSVTGLVTIMVRNRTQGTVTRRVIRLGAPPPRRQAVADGTQLTLGI